MAPSCKMQCSLSNPSAGDRSQLLAAWQPSNEMDDAYDPARVDYAPKGRRQLWLAALKPPMYSVGIVPVLVSGSASAANLSKFEQI